jgi:hypothetical protein
MKKYILFVGLLSLLGCGDENAPATKEQKRISLKCGLYDVVVEPVRGDADKIQTAINGEKIQMNKAANGSGSKFEGRGAVAKVSILNKAGKWSLSIDGGNYIYCSQLNARK